ncbi:MAG TPA: IPT/TIG domain-containing protein [Acidimicrobiales bacterium]|nr:IPT/TIG domain-containing protein [Acidimicrobiales bacterium]
MRARTLLLIPALLLSLLPALAAEAAAPAAPADPSPLVLQPGPSVARSSTVDVRALAAPSAARADSADAAAPPARRLPRRSPNPEAAQRAKAAAAARSQEGGSPQPAAAEPRVVSAATSFPMTTMTDQFTALGEFVAPPDTQMAVSPNEVVEMVNVSWSIWSRTGTRLSGPSRLDTFFDVPSGYNFSDPRVIYDASTQRWFAIGIGYTCADPNCNAFASGQMYLNVSQTSDPAGLWHRYVAATNSSGVLYDQAKLGLNDDKVVIAWDDYSPNFAGAELRVYDKASALAGTALSSATLAPSLGRFSIAPAEGLSASTTAFAAYNNADPSGAVQTKPGPTVAVMTITGVPPAAVSITESFPTIRATSTPPPSPQSGSAALIDTGDDRFLHSVWKNGLMWTFGSAGCIPVGDTVVRSCGRLVQVSTAGTPAVTQDFDAGQSGAHLMFPAVSFNANDDSVAVFSRGSASSFAGVVAAGQLDTETGRLSSFVTVKAGEAVYNESSNTCFGSGANPGRFGDYSAAAPDPSSDDVWVAGEYSATTSNTTTKACNWGTAAGRIALDGPTVSSVSPTVGPNGGGNTVTINGSGFTTSSSVVFNSSSATSVTVVNSSKITATAPALSNVLSDVRVTTEYGTSPNTAADNYRFTAPAVVNAVTPNQGTRLGGEAVTLTGQRFTGATAVKFGGTPAASFTVVNDTKITAVTPAHALGQVDVTVDVGGVTGSVVAGDKYTFVNRSGYWMVDRTGHVYRFGDAKWYGNLGGRSNVVDIEPTPSGRGYWLLTEGGEVVEFGDAVKSGQPGLLPNGEITSAISANPNGAGYWVFTNKGRVFAYGGAPHKGDMSSFPPLNGPVLGSVATPSGQGYYMVASDGGIFAFGDARFRGSMGGQHLNGPVVGLAPDPDNDGYWLVATDGGTFAFNAGFRGSMGGKPLNKPMIGMVAYGNAYLMVASDGGIFNFATDKPFAGSLGDNPPPDPVSNVAPLNA